MVEHDEALENPIHRICRCRFRWQEIISTIRFYMSESTYIHNITMYVYVFMSYNDIGYLNYVINLLCLCML